LRATLDNDGEKKKQSRAREEVRGKKSLSNKPVQVNYRESLKQRGGTIEKPIRAPGLKGVSQALPRTPSKSLAAPDQASPTEKPIRSARRFDLSGLGGKLIVNGLRDADTKITSCATGGYGERTKSVKRKIWLFGEATARRENIRVSKKTDTSTTFKGAETDAQIGVIEKKKTAAWGTSSSPVESQMLAGELNKRKRMYGREVSRGNRKEGLQRRRGVTLPFKIRVRQVLSAASADRGNRAVRDLHPHTHSR